MEKGGRKTPTETIREWWHKAPLLWILCGGGFLVFLGSCLGHLFW